MVDAASLPAAPFPSPVAVPGGAKRTPKRQRQHVRSVRFDDAELAKLEARAGDSGLSLGAYLRACSLETAGLRARRRAPVDRELLAHTNADLNRIGNNLNQIARNLNMGKDLPPSFVAQTTVELRDVLATLRRAFGYDSQG